MSTDLSDWDFEVLTDTICSVLGKHRGTCSTIAGKIAPEIERIIERAQADAWDAGVKKASPHGGAYLRSILAENPHRTT